jgi:hypothetical protein
MFHRIEFREQIGRKSEGAERSSCAREKYGTATSHAACGTRTGEYASERHCDCWATAAAA